MRKSWASPGTRTGPESHLGTHGHIKGFAAQPQRPAFDVVLQAETGYISMTGTADHPAKLPIALIDVLAAYQLKQGDLMDRQRDRTGKGAYVEVSLEAAALSGLINQASNFLMAEAVAKPLGTLHPNIAPYGELFTCADGGRLILAVGSDAQFAALVHHPWPNHARHGSAFRAQYGSRNEPCGPGRSPSAIDRNTRTR